jgi:hypothetical protein
MTISFLKAGADLSLHGSPMMDWFHRIFNKSRWTDPKVRKKLETLRQLVLQLEGKKLCD